MKKTKFISCLLSAVLILSAITVPVAAADVNQNSSGGTATVSYTNDSVWTATIPAYVAPVEAGQQDVSAYEVAVKDVVIGDNQQLAATIEYSGYVTEANGVKIPYQLYDSDGEEIRSGDTIISKNAGEPGTEAAITFGAALTDSPKYAGVYTDTATFTFTAKDKVYTLDEINADEHLFAIGKTKPEYVVAEFNDDFSEVTIFANGEDSDGKMDDFGYYNSDVYGEPSPMCEARENLTKIFVKPGITSIGERAFLACKNVVNVYLSDGITEIGGHAFNGCSSLTEIELPKSLTKIYNGAFSGCSLLESIAIPYGVSVIGMDTFTRCSSLNTVSIPNSVVNISMRAFQYCTSISEIFIPNSVQKIESDAFRECSNLEVIKGMAGSYAETWATDNGYTFIAQ